MARVKKYLDTRASDNHERWLVSYADFITLLFAFFVVMYAVSTVNEARYRVVGSAIGTAFGIAGAGALPGQQAAQGSVVPLPAGGARGEDARRRYRERIAQTQKSLAVAVGPLAASEEVPVHQTGRGIVVDIGAGTLFAPGDATLRPAARAPLAAVAEVLKGLTLPVEVEGHTDSTPIRGGPYPSNWELSAARAATVVRFLQANGVAADRLAAVGYAEFKPVASNRHPEGRARNRRISLVVLDPEPPGSAPAPGEGAAQLSYPPMEFKVD
jgi:chemotaxis protein MotB